MNIVDILITIIVVTILVTIVLGVATYLAYKLRLARKPGRAVTRDDEPRYFQLHLPPAPTSDEAASVDAEVGSPTTVASGA